MGMTASRPASSSSRQALCAMTVTAELEYRAKLVEFHYSSDLSLLQKFLSEANESKTNDAHAVASVRIKREFADTDHRSLPCVQTQALKLLHAHTKEMEEKYGGQRNG